MDKTYKDDVMDTIDLVMEAIECVLVPERILKSGPATIVFWRNGQKTIVKCSKGTEPDDYSAFCAAFTKHIFGTNSKIRRILKDITVVQEPKKKAEPPKEPEPKQTESPKKPTVKRSIDRGKVMALHNAGWSNKKIADEMGCTSPAVWKIIAAETKGE